MPGDDKEDWEALFDEAEEGRKGLQDEVGALVHERVELVSESNMRIVQCQKLEGENGLLRAQVRKLTDSINELRAGTGK